MITHKQYPNHHIFETEIGGRTFTVETGKVAELCNAEAICRYGDTVVLVTAVASPLPKAGIDPNPFNLALCWNAGLDTVLRAAAPVRAYQYANRVQRRYRAR